MATADFHSAKEGVTPNAEEPSTMQTVEAYLRADSRPIRQSALFERDVRDYGTGIVNKECFISPDYHYREVEKLWSRVWQLACLEQDIPDVGDYTEYVIADQSILLVRETPTRIRAFYNACRHRGTRLKVGCGNSREIRCGFHAWAWNLDGTLKDIPCRWDFPAVRDEEYRLGECQVAAWNGFVFINMDRNAQPLEEFLGPTILRQFAQWPSLGKRWKAVHIEKELNCNWKLALLAFVEAYHAFRVHPQWINYSGDANAQYDAYGLHARLIAAVGVPSPHRGQPPSEQRIVEEMIQTEFADLFSKVSGPVTVPEVPPGKTARAVLADYRRADLTKRTNVDFSAASDAEMLDLIQYFVFPNVALWVGEGAPLVYRSRPNGHDPNSCIYETMVLLPEPEGTERRRAATPKRVPMSQTYTDGAPELGGSVRVFDQDASNLARMQLGQHSRGFQGPMYGRYQEMNIRQFHHNLDEWLR
jgi:phenylpropionate dioxygenase-like ring-hydroxylating dioxygenase large terminal subunit